MLEKIHTFNSLEIQLLLLSLFTFVIGGWSWYWARKWYRFKLRLRRWKKNLEEWAIRKYKQLQRRACIIKGYYECWERFFNKMYYDHDFSELFSLIFYGLPEYFFYYLEQLRIYLIIKIRYQKNKPKKWLINWLIKKIWKLYYIIKAVAIDCFYTDLIMLFLWFRHNMATKVWKIPRLIGGLFAIFFHYYYLLLYRYMHYRAFCKAAYSAAYFLDIRAYLYPLLIYIYMPWYYAAPYVDFSDCCYDTHIFVIPNFEVIKWWWIQ